jgi:hypothetical protein
VFDGLPESLAIFDVAGVVADAGVKDVVERMPPEEQVADHPQALPVGLVRPQPPQVANRVDAPLLVSHHCDKTAVGRTLLPQQSPHLPLILLDECYDALPEVLRNVLGFVLDSLLFDF